MTPAAIIQNYLLLNLPREFPGLDVWRANVVAAKAGRRFIRAGESGQADLTGIWGGRCRDCGGMINADRTIHVLDGIDTILGATCEHPIAPFGRSIWIEVKHRDSQKPAQRDFERRVTRLGALYIICRIKDPVAVDQLRILTEKPCGVHPAEMQAFFDELRSKL